MSIKWWTEDCLQKPSLKKHTKNAVFITLTIALAITSAGCSLLPDETKEEEIPIIQPPKLSEKPEYTVTTETLETSVRGTGKLMSTHEENLFFTGSDSSYSSSGGGYVKEIYVNPGDYVEAGTIIMELDVQDLQDELRSKRLSFRSAELQMKKDLRERESYTDEEFERMVIDFEEQKLEITELEEQIARSKLTAPFSGTIVSINVNKGDQVEAYDPVALIADLTQLTVAAKLSSDDVKKIAPGMETVVEINGAGQHKGTVKQLPVNTDDENQGRYDSYYYQSSNDMDSIEDYVIVDLESMPEGLSRGTPLSVRIIVNRKENAVVIPPSALRTYGGRTYVQVVEEDGTKREVDVEVGQQASTVVEILEGLEPGQKVVGK